MAANVGPQGVRLHLQTKKKRPDCVRVSSFRSPPRGRACLESGDFSAALPQLRFGCPVESFRGKCGLGIVRGVDPVRPD